MTDVLDQCGRAFITGLLPGAQKHKDFDAFTLHRVWNADRRSLADSGMRYQGRLNFGGSDAMTCYVEHIIGAAKDGDVSMFVLKGEVSGDVRPSICCQSRS